MNPLALLRGLFRALQGGSDPRHVAAGAALGAAWGLVPKGNLFSAVFLVLFFFFRVDKGMAFFVAALFTPLGYLLDGAAHAVGCALLSSAALKPLWTRLYGLPLVPWTKFNNTVVLGSLALGLILYVPLYALALRLVLHYQTRWRERVARLRVVKALTGLRVVQLWQDWSR